MKHAKLFSILVGFLLLSYGAIGYYFLPMASFQGDLTRMGMLPESAFGWRKDRPLIDATLLQQASLQEADVLVIGDSFSDDRIWQTALTKRGLKVRTEPWSSMRGVCEDFIPWLRGQGFKGNYVILETIERNLTDGLKRFVACRKMDIHPSILSDAPRHPPATNFDPDHGDTSGRFSVGIQTMLNYYRYQAASRAIDFKSATLPNGVNVTRVANGCDMFSHTRCKDMLFLGSDSPQDIADATLEDMSILNTRLTGITPIWVIVPNKSTSYLYPNKLFWHKAAQRFNAPNLLQMTQQAIQAKTIDLYPANNTHFSTIGYLLMGDAIYQKMQDVAQPRHQ